LQGELPLTYFVCRAAPLLTVGSSMQNDPVVSKASELLRLGLMPSVDTIKAGQVSQLFDTLLRWEIYVATAEFV
jgi:hypothetical protein